MNKVSFVRRVRTVIPLIGIPLKNYGGIYVSTTTSYECLLKASYRFVRCSTESLSKVNEIVRGNVIDYVNNYVNKVLGELTDMHINGEMFIDCSLKVPDVVLFVIGTTELFLNIFGAKRIEYDDYQRIFATLDRMFWGIESPYLVSLRCAYLNKATCISRDVHEAVSLDAIDVGVEFLSEGRCYRDLCLELDNPYDNITVTYMLKFITHVVAKVAQDLSTLNFLSKSAERYLKLLYDIEMRLALENMEREGSINTFDTLVKPVADVSSIKIYKLKMKCLDEG